MARHTVGRAVTIAAGIACAMSTAARAGAQTRDTTARATAIDPVVTTATRDARALRGVTASVTVVDSLAISRIDTQCLQHRTLPRVVFANDEVDTPQLGDFEVLQ